MTTDTLLTPRMERRNQFVFIGANLLILLAAPIIYVGVVQAALCQRLGASASVANLPSAAYLLGQLAPFFLSSVVPHRFERLTVVLANSTTALSCFIIATCLVVRLPDAVTIAAITGQGLLQGSAVSVSLVFLYQCLGRGTRLEARAKTMKITFTLAPISAVAGSLVAQFVLNHGFHRLQYPHDFALVYLGAAICMGSVATLASRFDLIPIPDEPRQPLWPYVRDSVVEYTRSRSFVMLWIGYALWFSTLSVVPNLSLYSREAVGRLPQELAGLTMVIRFGGKSIAGYLLGALALRYGIRAPVVATFILVGAASAWGWLVPGYAYLAAFALMGGGELGGAYVPNYIISMSTPAAGVRNLSLLMLATPAATIGAVLHGTIADRWGFHASFLFGLITAVMAWLLVARLPAAPGKELTESSSSLPQSS